MKNKTESAKQISEGDLLAAMQAGISAVERGDYKQGYKALHAAYGRNGGAAPLPPDGLSHYGLCVALVEKQTRKGADLCRTAIDAQFYDSVHFVNLVRLYILRHNRRNAIDALHEGLSRLPDDRRLLELRAEIGYRQKPVVPFLDRSNPVNTALGKLRAANTRVKKKGEKRSV